MINEPKETPESSPKEESTAQMFVATWKAVPKKIKWYMAGVIALIFVLVAFA